MFLKALTLKGFKSFADPTTLELEPGVTVVVGPNGSGKSNVVDAIGWVLGAQAPKAVRSQKMDDVIFAGTAKRPALGRAEVSITLDNTSGLLPIEFSEVKVTRTLWRSGDSEYAINEVPCRLLDVQDLFSDTGVGRQQHVIIGQGQIDSVLNARPEDRRMVVEEAAGVLKHRKRKERAERRLTATEGNLQRLQDLQREVRRQLRPLQKQADAARRHGALMDELRTLQVFIVGRELSTLRRRLSDASAARSELDNEERMVQTRLADLDAQVVSAEAELGAFGGDDLGDEQGMVEALREKARGLLAILDERRRGLDRERAAFTDRSVVGSLQADLDRQRAELAEQEARISAAEPELEALTQDEAVLATDRTQFDQDFRDVGSQGAVLGAKRSEVATVSEQVAGVRGELSALTASAGRSASDLANAQQRATQLHKRVERLAEEIADLDEQLATAADAEDDLFSAAEATTRARQGADQAAEAATAAYEQAQAERHSLEGRAEALAVALDDARSRAGADHLEGVDGVVGTLLDLVDIDPGWEAAVEAACGEALRAIVVSSVEAGRSAVTSLARGDVTGAVLALGAQQGALATPPVGEPVRRHVRAHSPEVAPLLDSLLDAAVCIEQDDPDTALAAALDAALTHPDAVVVTAAGGRFAATGWRAVTSTTGATGAALEQAREAAADAAGRADEAQEANRAARAAREEAREAEETARRALEEHKRNVRAASDKRERALRDRHEAEAETASLAEQLVGASEGQERQDARIAELESQLPELEAAEAEAQAAVEAERLAANERSRTMARARHELDQRATDLVARRKELEVRAAAAQERRTSLTQQVADTEQRLASTTDAVREAELRRSELDRSAEVLANLGTFVRAQAQVVDECHADLKERRRQQSEEQRRVMARLDGLRRERMEAESSLGEVRERIQRSELDEAEVRMRLEQTTESCRTQLDVEPHVAIAAEPPEMAEGMTPAARVRELERELKVIGPINPLALEEFEALQERYEFLQAQLDDVRSSRKELSKVIRAVDEEIANVFAAAFADVSENFTQLFTTLFPGGEGGLRLTNPEALLESGIEIEARPSGKNVRKLSLLSGGERSLTALAFLFAVFRSRPSPFYVMDEVEAALDDVNLHRFLGLVAEFRQDAQLVIVSHQKRTMEAAECLYGVTMQPGGSSRVVSEKVAAA